MIKCRRSIAGVVALMGAITVTSANAKTTVVLAADVPSSGSFTAGAVVFHETSTGSGVPGFRVLSLGGQIGSELTDSAGVSDILLHFPTAYERVGLDVAIGPSTYEVKFYGVSNNLLGSV